MSFQEDYKNRQIVPRWLPFKVASFFGKINSLSQEISPKIVSASDYQMKEAEWLVNRQLPYATDLVGSALIIADYQNPNAIEAAKFIIANREKTSTLACESAERFLRIDAECNTKFDLESSTQKTFKVQRKISALKAYVRNYPLNSIAWLDLAYYYCSVGQIEKAQPCVQIALSINSENRFILRSAARFFLHIGDPEQALEYLRRADITNWDPSLVSAEISISEVSNVRSRKIKNAEFLLGDPQPTWQFSELLGTMGTLEATEGNNKKAKRYFNDALAYPNENTVAQAEWISDQIGLLVPADLQIPALFEADFRRYFREREYDKALNCSLKWLRYQPFTARPANFATYLAAVCLEDFKKSKEIIEGEAWQLLTKDFLLRNNYAFALACLDQQAEAEMQLGLINLEKLDEAQRATYHATLGLINFRKGNAESGRLNYLKAMEKFRVLGQEHSLCLASYFYAKEELRIKSTDGNEAWDMAQKMASKLQMHELIKS